MKAFDFWLSQENWPHCQLLTPALMIRPFSSRGSIAYACRPLPLLLSLSLCFSFSFSLSLFRPLFLSLFLPSHCPFLSFSSLRSHSLSPFYFNFSLILSVSLTTHPRTHCLPDERLSMRCSAYLHFMFMPSFTQISLFSNLFSIKGKERTRVV